MLGPAVVVGRVATLPACRPAPRPRQAPRRADHGPRVDPAHRGRERRGRRGELARGGSGVAFSAQAGDLVSSGTNTMTNCHVTEELHPCRETAAGRDVHRRRRRTRPVPLRPATPTLCQAWHASPRRRISRHVGHASLFRPSSSRTTWQVVGERTGVTRILTTLEGTDPGVPFAARMLRLSAPTAEVRHVLDRYLRVTQLGRGARNAPPGAMSAATAAGNSPSRRYLTYKPPIGKCHPE